MGKREHGTAVRTYSPSALYELAKIQTCATHEDLIAQMAHPGSSCDGLFGADISADEKNPARYARSMSVRPDSACRIGAMIPERKMETADCTEFTDYQRDVRIVLQTDWMLQRAVPSHSYSVFSVQSVVLISDFRMI